jgi:D-serine deaminase-like pyridoxal phosphate-dependent protein
MTHAGGSFSVEGAEADAAIAEVERWAAEALHAARLPCRVVSVGSTPRPTPSTDFSE